MLLAALLLVDKQAMIITPSNGEIEVFKMLSHRLIILTLSQFLPFSALGALVMRLAVEMEIHHIQSNSSLQPKSEQINVHSS